MNSVKGSDLYKFAKILWPINRSITGNGLRQTLKLIKNEIPSLKIFEIKSGNKAFDWSVPLEWNIKEAWIKTPSGKKIANLDDNNLHLVGYSIPVKKKLPLKRLKKHLHTIPKIPNAIPYVTSYYNKNWGFCLSHNSLKLLKEGIYEVFINSSLKKGSLTYGEVIIPGKSKKEILLSTYICHPSLANNEISGPCVTTFLAKWLRNINNRFTYRIIFIPETIGSIVYLKKNLKKLKKNLIAGFVITCVGDNNCYSFVPSKQGNTISDLVAQRVLKRIDPNFKKYSFLDRGSDERQYCSPGVDLPVASITRSKYYEYPEYHTSFDNLDFISAYGLKGSFKVFQKTILEIERSIIPKTKFLCEPQLGKKNLFPKFSNKNNAKEIYNILNLITYSNGLTTLKDISEIINLKFKDTLKLAILLKRKKIIEFI